MEGVTDAPMRRLQTESGAFTHCVTEFLRISQNVQPLRCFTRHSIELGAGSTTPSGTPVIFQLLGGDGGLLAASAARAVEGGAQAIDINFGCPAATVNSHDGGATLLKYPDRIESIVSEVRKAVPSTLPVSVKMRLGWENPEDIYENAKRAENGGASWLTIHGRTKMQGYMPPAYWEPIGKVRSSLSIPVIANGEIWTLEDFKKCREQSGCEHFMIGRGALANPALALQVAQELGILKNQKQTLTSSDWHALIYRFMEIANPLSDNPLYTLKRLKQWLKYAHLRQHFADFSRIKTMEDISAFRSVVSELKFR